jgi:hypothetical protein
MILVSEQHLVVKTYKGPINFRLFERDQKMVNVTVTNPGKF